MDETTRPAHDPAKPIGRSRPWYRDPRFSIGLVVAPAFFFTDQLVQLIAPGIDPHSALHIGEAIKFISGALLLVPLATLIESVTEYYEHNFHHRHDRYNALLRAGLLHTTFTNVAFLVLTLATLNAAEHSGGSGDLVRIVQVSIAGSIVVSILFTLGISIFIGGLNVRAHGGRLNFSKELANQDAELIAIAVVVLSLPTLASHFNISPSLTDSVVYRLPLAGVGTLSVVVSVILIVIYVSYFFWTLLRLGDRVGQTNEDVQADVMHTIARAVNKVFATQGKVSLVEALQEPNVYYASATDREKDRDEVAAQMDELDASLEREEEEERAHAEMLAEENARRIHARTRASFSLFAPIHLLRYLLVAAAFILLSPVLALYRLAMLPIRVRRQRKAEAEIRALDLAMLPEEESVRRMARDKRRAERQGEPAQADPVLHVVGRIVILLVGGGGAVYVLDQMARSIEGGLVEGIGLNPFFVGFIVLPIATGLVDLVTSVRKAWRNDLQNTLAITTGSAVQSALLIGPIILLASRLPFVNLPDINLVFGLFILGVFGLIAYFYQIMTVDGETTWFEGAQLLGIFAAVALVVFFAQNM